VVSIARGHHVRAYPPSCRTATTEFSPTAFAYSSPPINARSCMYNRPGRNHDLIGKGQDSDADEDVLSFIEEPNSYTGFGSRVLARYTRRRARAATSPSEC